MYIIASYGLLFFTIMCSTDIEVHYKAIQDKIWDVYKKEPMKSDFLHNTTKFLKFGPSAAVGCAYSCRASSPRAYCDGFYHNATNNTCYLFFNQVSSNIIGLTFSQLKKLL